MEGVIDYALFDEVQMKKAHPCNAKSKRFQIVRVGADIKIKCLGCGNVIMMERPEFERKCKKIIEKAKDNDQSDNI